MAMLSTLQKLARIGILYVIASPAIACEFEVSTTADDGGGSLRRALEAAALRPADTCRIHFGDAEGGFSTPQVITLERPLPTVTSQVVIDGYIRGLLWKAYGATISGDDRLRLFEVATSGSLTLRGVTLRGGRAERGGAILNHGELIVDGVTLIGNRAAGEGGALFNNAGRVWWINTTAIDNRALRGGAIATRGGGVNVVHATFQNNTAQSGGALFADGQMVVSNSILAGEGSQCVMLGDFSDHAIQNLIEGNHVGCGRPVLSADPRFEALGHYNGPTPTLPLNGSSPAINLALAVHSIDAEGQTLRWDQRGNGDPRFAGGYADLGAFERQSMLPDVLEVNVTEDDGLRNCTGVRRNGCSLRAAIELAAAARRPVPIRFDPEVFDEPVEIVLPELHSRQALDLAADEQAAITLVVKRPVAWRLHGGIRVVLESKHSDGQAVDG